MRKASTLVSLILVAFSAGASAEESAPAMPAPAAPIAIPPVTPASSAPNAVTAPAETVAAPAVVEAGPRDRRIEVGLSFLPMALGKITTPVGSKSETGDALLAYGVGLSVSYRVIAGLSVGVNPQLISNVNYKLYPEGLMGPAASKEYDLMGRLAYTIPIVEAVSVYGEVLPGYSKISQPGANPSAGFVLALGVGVTMDLSDRIFTNIGGGYQLGFQNVKVSGASYEDRVKFVRLALGLGVRF